MSRVLRNDPATQFMKNLVVFALIAVAITGCASSGNRVVYTQSENEFREWSQRGRIILVTESRDVPEDILLVRESKRFVDAARGAGKGFVGGAGIGGAVGCVMLIWIPPPGLGCVLGAIVFAPPAAVAGLAVGGIAGAAGSEPRETSRPLARLREAPVLLHNASDWRDLEQSLSSALVEKANRRVPHTFRQHRHELPRPVFPTDRGFRDAATPPDPQWSRSGTDEEFEVLLRDRDIDGILVLDLVEWGFVHVGELDPEDADPELMLFLRASSTLHFVVEERIEKASFETQTYADSWHRLSDFTAGNGSVLGQELRNGVHGLADHLLADLEHARQEQKSKGMREMEFRGLGN